MSRVRSIACSNLNDSEHVCISRSLKWALVIKSVHLQNRMTGTIKFSRLVWISKQTSYDGVLFYIEENS